MPVRIVLGSDHAGYGLKKEVEQLLVHLGHEVRDMGCYSEKSVDYPDYSDKVCAEIIDGRADFGILVCGTGLGMSMAANRHRHIRAALCHEPFSARMSREHNNANVLCLGSRITGVALALEIVSAWLKGEFLGGRHQCRIDKLT